MEINGASVEKKAKLKLKIEVTYNNGLKEISTYKRIWEKNGKYFIKNSVGELTEIENKVVYIQGYKYYDWKYK